MSKRVVVPLAKRYRALFKATKKLGYDIRAGCGRPSRSDIVTAGRVSEPHIFKVEPAFFAATSDVPRKAFQENRRMI